MIWAAGALPRLVHIHLRPGGLRSNRQRESLTQNNAIGRTSAGSAPGQQRREALGVERRGQAGGRVPQRRQEPELGEGVEGEPALLLKGARGTGMDCQGEVSSTGNASDRINAAVCVALLRVCDPFPDVRTSTGGCRSATASRRTPRGSPCCLLGKEEGERCVREREREENMEMRTAVARLFEKKTVLHAVLSLFSPFSPVVRPVADILAAALLDRLERGVAGDDVGDRAAAFCLVLGLGCARERDRVFSVSSPRASCLVLPPPWINRERTNTHNRML